MAESVSQLIIVLLIFAGVLCVTWAVTKWISGYQKSARAGANIQLVDSAPLTTGKYIQIVRIGDRYLALAVYKDGVTLLGDVDASSITFPERQVGTADSFKSVLERLRTGQTNVTGDPDVHTDADGDA